MEQSTLSTRRALRVGWLNGSRKLIIVGVVTTAALMLLSAILAVIIWQAWLDDDPWDPLGEFPTQQVTNGPKIPVDGTVNVTATKCADVTVTTRGSSSWTSVTPPGTIIPSGQGVGSREAGCTTIDYANPIPEAVLASVAAGGPTVWKIVGTETPFDEDREGVPRAWATEEFELIPVVAPVVAP